jgi:hypothetical protein
MAGDRCDKYTAAAERGFEARKAGLQAKKDEQPANTARSYLAKQREWIVSALRPLPLSLLLSNVIYLYRRANVGYRSGARRRVPHRTGPSIPGRTASS